MPSTRMLTELTHGRTGVSRYENVFLWVAGERWSQKLPVHANSALERTVNVSSRARRERRAAPHYAARWIRFYAAALEGQGNMGQRAAFKPER